MKFRGFFLPLILLFAVAPVEAQDFYKYTSHDGKVYLTDTGGSMSRLVAASKPRARTVAYSRNSYTKLIREKARKYGLDPHLVKAIIWAESNFNPHAISRRGALGLMQLMPATASEMGVSRPFNPEQNVDGGTKYFKYLLKRYRGDLTLALAAYNAGPTNVDKYGRVPPIRETRNYVKKVVKYYNEEKNGRGFSRKQNIYKVRLKSGTVVYTDSQFYYSGAARRFVRGY